MTTHPKQVNDKLRAQKALQLRAAGKTYQQIADELGYTNKGTAYNTIRRNLDGAVTVPAQELIALELHRLDELHRAHWDAATRPGTTKAAVDRQVKAATIILRISQRRAKLLGLDDYERRLVDLAERRQKLDERDSKLAIEFFTRVMNRIGLSDEQRELLAQVMPEELKAITAPAPPLTDDGEILEEDES